MVEKAMEKRRIGELASLMELITSDKYGSNSLRNESRSALVITMPRHIVF